MARIKVEIPHQFKFSTSISIRISDLNYGGHVGNDTLLSIIHEARIQFLKYNGYEELNFAGAGLIMSDVAIEFKSEVFYGDIVTAYVSAGDFTRSTFDIYYKLQKVVNSQAIVVAIAKSGMVCYDYNRKKIVAIPEEAKLVLTNKK